MRPFLISSFLSFAFHLSSVLSFSVTFGSSPTQCGPLNVSWTGGQAPFQIILIPAFDIPRNISVPSASFNNNQGSYEIPAIPFTKGFQFLLTMSDATGFGTGGVSELLTVGAPVGNASCNTTDPPLPFSFSLPSALQQCNPYLFSYTDKAVLPITIAGLIPGGDSFLLHTSASGSNYTWLADVAAGTSIIFSLTDAAGNTGGSSDVESVLDSNEASCLNANSPSSTVSSMPSFTSSTTSSTSSPKQTTSGVSTGTIVGAVAGALLAIIAITGVAIFYLRRHYRGSLYGLAPTRNSRRTNSVELDPGTDNFQHPPIFPFPYQSDSVSHLPHPIIPAASASYLEASPTINPFVHASGMPDSQQHARANSNTDSFGDVAGSSMTSNGRRKAAMAGVTAYQPSTRFIVHTDAEDRFSEDDTEVVELPPQYSERRAPPIIPAGEMSTLMTGPSATNVEHIDEPL